MLNRRARVAAIARWGCTMACVATAGLWIRSGWIEEWVYRELPGQRLAAVGISQGRVVVGLLEQMDSAGNWYRNRRFDGPTWYWSLSAEYGNLVRYQAVPLWASALVFAAPAGLLWYQHQRRGYGAGRCPKCGYDLSGAPSTTCPECGTEEA